MSKIFEVVPPSQPARRIVRDIRRRGNDEGHGIADEAHLAMREHGAIGDAR